MYCILATIENINEELKFTDQRQAIFPLGSVWNYLSGHIKTIRELYEKSSHHSYDISKLYEKLSNHSEDITQLYKKSSNHLHDGNGSQRIEPTNLVGVSDKFTSQNINKLVNESNASGLHYHRAIPRKARTYHMPLYMGVPLAGSNALENREPHLGEECLYAAGEGSFYIKLPVLLPRDVIYMTSMYISIDPYQHSHATIYLSLKMQNDTVSTFSLDVGNGSNDYQVNKEFDPPISIDLSEHSYSLDVQCMNKTTCRTIIRVINFSYEFDTLY